MQYRNVIAVEIKLLNFFYLICRNSHGSVVKKLNFHRHTWVLVVLSPTSH